MNWLMGNNQAIDDPETPAHKWVFNALKGVVMPETPFPKTATKPSVGQGHLQNSILKGSRFTREKRTHSVTFHKSVRTPPKRTSRSSLPRDFSGKFPSPYTPKVSALEDAALESDGKDYEESPIAAEKDRREAARSTTNNPLKKLSLQLNESKNESGARAGKNPTRPSDTHTAHLRQQHEKPLKWDVDQGFEEVLQSIHRNNNYLQSLINEMQDSCGQIDESFTDDRSVSGSDVTVNLDEPRSRSGQYWKAKFSDFSALTTKVKAEQDNMQRALMQLKHNIEARSHRQAGDWKDKHDVLLEELEKAQKANRNSAQIREVRELRKQAREAETISKERDDLKEQLKIADAQIQDLKAHNWSPDVPTLTRVAQEKPKSPLPMDTKVSSHELELRKSDNKHQISRHKEETTPVANKTDDIVHKFGSLAVDLTSQAPQSATARRLAKAQALSATSGPANSLSEASKVSTLSHRQESKTNLVVARPYPTHTTTRIGIHQDTISAGTFTFNKSQARTITSSSPAVGGDELKKIVATKESPRPAFASLNVNVQSAPALALNSEEAAKKHARFEAAKERLAQRRLKREREKAQAVLVR